MSRSLNRVTLIGNVGGDPEIRTTSGGGRVASFSVATTRQWTGQSGDKQEKTEWHKVVAWDSARGAKLADVVERFVKKGDKIYIEGRIEYRTWQDKDNQTRYATDINANEIILLGGRGGSGGDGGAPRARSASPAKAKAGAGADGAGGGDFEEFDGAEAETEDEDLPF